MLKTQQEYFQNNKKRIYERRKTEKYKLKQKERAKKIAEKKKYKQEFEKKYVDDSINATGINTDGLLPHERAALIHTQKQGD